MKNFQESLLTSSLLMLQLVIVNFDPRAYKNHIILGKITGVLHFTTGVSLFIV